MALLVGQLIEILQRYDRDREVMIHTLKGETVDVNGYFVQRDLDDNGFYLTNLDVIPSDWYETRNMTDFDNNSILNLFIWGVPWLILGAVLGFITLFIVPAAPLWAFSIGLLLVTTDRLIEVNKYNNERRRISQEA